MHIEKRAVVPEHIEELMIKSLMGKLTSPEETSFKAWLEISNDNSKLYSDLKSTWILISANREILTLDKEAAYNKIRQQINGGAKKRVLQNKDREEKETSGIKSIMIWWQRVAAVVIIPFMIYSIYTISNNNNPISEQQPIYSEIFSPNGVRTKHMLPDSSIVWLNVGSSISYPTPFNADKREVKVIGEAMLEVTHKDSQPFMVNLDDKASIEVLGTTFNCTAYRDSKDIITTLIEGKINFTGGVEQVTITPNTRVTYSNNRIKIDENVNPLEDIAWREGLLIFNKAPMEDVIHKLQRWYNVEIEVKDKSLYKEVITATFRSETLPRVLKLLELSTPIRCKLFESSDIKENFNIEAKIELYSSQH